MAKGKSVRGCPAVDPQTGQRCVLPAGHKPAWDHRTGNGGMSDVKERLLNLLEANGIAREQGRRLLAALADKEQAGSAISPDARLAPGVGPGRPAAESVREPDAGRDEMAKGALIAFARDVHRAAVSLSEGRFVAALAGRILPADAYALSAVEGATPPAAPVDGALRAVLLTARAAIATLDPDALGIDLRDGHPYRDELLEEIDTALRVPKPKEA